MRLPLWRMAHLQPGFEPVGVLSDYVGGDGLFF